MIRLKTPQVKKVIIKELTIRERSNTILVSEMHDGPGEMPERSKGAVLKTAARKCRGFESLSLRCPFRCPAPSFCENAGEVAERLKATAC
jgi:hypothetical protein